MNSYPINFDDGELTDLLEMRLNPALQMQFWSITLDGYWCSAMVALPRLCETALSVLTPLVTTCQCETCFCISISQMGQNMEIASMHRHTCVLLSVTWFHILKNL